MTKNYKWSQSITDVTVQLTLDKPTRSKELNVELKYDKISIRRKENNSIIIEGNFYDNVKVDDSAWNIEDGRAIILNLEKAQENIWKSVIKGDEEIDATKVDNTKNLDEFDDETQGALRKIIYEQNRKAQGLPTTEEEKQQDILKQAWNAEGSPFKGQPFDPSKLTLPGGQSFN